MMPSADIAFEETNRRVRFSAHGLDAETRAQVKRLHKRRPKWNMILFCWPTVWTCALVAMVNSPSAASGLVWVFALLAIALAIQAMAVLMHEATHGNLFRDRRLNRFAAFVCGSPFVFAAAAYRVAHLNHHRHTRTAKDQDEIVNYCTNDRQYRVLFYAWFFIGTVLYFFIVPLTALSIATRHERRQIGLEYLGLFSMYMTVALLWNVQIVITEWLIWGWFVPALLASLILNVRGHAEHLCTAKGNHLTQTRTTTSNPFISFIMLNVNFHLEHHLFPGVPWYNLPRLHQVLRPFYARHHVFIQRSYLSYAVQAILGGDPFREIRD